MSWIEVKAGFEAGQDLSPYIDLFGEFGIENTLEEGDSLTGCLVSVDGSEARINELESALKQAGALYVQTRDLVEDNWEVAWRQFFKPRRVGQRFVVRPTWESFESSEGDLVIVLDPGQAFGTGDHPTTRLCLELMEGADISGRRVLDIGCGSGILSIGACLLGATSVMAIDIDPIAVEVAKENRATNQVDFEAVVGEGVLVYDETWDVVVSNIISATLIRLARDVRVLVSPGGRWIISGVISDNWPDVLAAAQSAGFGLVTFKEEDGWVAATFTC
ncbi:MAG: 50S ribosomal protein L11 methyltransferase [Fimbriimonas sp.]|nr:50S ribosomal protein L11 methyltransferase [Fimbriimonas sp.]